MANDISPSHFFIEAFQKGEFDQVITKYKSESQDLLKSCKIRNTTTFFKQLPKIGH